MASTITAEDWLDAVGHEGGHQVVQFSDTSDLPPGVIEAYVPEGFDLHLHADRCSLVVTDGALGRFQFAGELISESADGSGAVARTLDFESGVAEHRYFYLPPEAWQRGIGRRMVRRSGELCASLGIRRIELYAEALGKYAWARCGFDFTDELVAAEVHAAMSELVRDLELGNELPQLPHSWSYGALDLDEAGNAVTVSARHLAEVLGEWSALGHYGDEAELPLSKALLLYSRYEGWSGLLDLEAESLGRERMLSYTAGYE